MYSKIISVALMLFTTVLTAQEIKYKSTPSEATVYLQSARVVETAKVNLQKGKNSITIERLPNSIDVNTYQVGLNGGAILLSVTPSTNYLSPEEYSDDEKTLLDQKKSLQTKLKLLNAEISTLNGELSLIEQNQKIGNNDSGWTAEELTKLAAYYAKRTLEIRQLLVNQNLEQEDFNQQIRDIENQINLSVKDRNANRNELILEIEAPKSTASDIKITYVTPSAGWQPFYDIRATDIESPIDIITKGKVYQSTGKDWKNVQLSVSTYLPKSNQNRPILNPFYVGEAQINQVQGYAKRNEAVLNSYQVRDAEESMALDEVVVTEVLPQQLNILYKVTGTQTVSTTEKGQTFVLEKQSVEADFIHHAVPKIAEDVFLLANIKNWQALNLLLTEANIYFEENYVGKTTIDPNYTKDEFPISLGVDERIVVKRRLLDNLESNKFLSNKKVDDYAYEFKIRNNSGDDITLEILDQIPIAQNNKIEIEEVETNGGVLDEKTKSILWTENISRGSGKTINFSYQIKYPKEMELQFY